MNAGTVRCQAEVETIDGTWLVRLSEKASRQLPSRGQVAGRAAINGHAFATVIEPDGRRGHWIRMDRALLNEVGVGAGQTAQLTFEVSPEWPEPEIPDDLATALAEARESIRAIWQDITPMARWEWVRWVRATANSATRARRVDVSISKLDSGKRRPCCFDLSSCTDPQVARGGKLREPSQPG